MAYTHKHHIVPRHVGGTDDDSNLIELTIDAHAEAHRILWETHGREEDRVAWLGLSKMIDGEEARRLAQRHAVIKALKGKPHFHGEKIGAAMRGRPLKESHRKAMMGKRPHVNQTGGKNNAAKRITTPYGNFESVQDAIIHFGKGRGYVRHRLESVNHPEWNFVEGEV
jgi:hypothetical protein